MTTKNRRKKLKIVHNLQIKYTFSLLIPFIFILLIVELQMYFIIKTLLPSIEFLAVKNTVINSIVIIMLEVFFLLVIAGFFNIVYLHRIAGPINRLVNEIEEMLKTNRYHTLVVRKKDELKPLIFSFNKILEKLIVK
ncbi:MAG: hypothetical protein N2643_01270 [Endomicrobia bacterium]|nr:hypothetical protein [Endomicrobiia bacterium]